MLVGGDLGFLFSTVVAALAVVLTPLLGFVVRRKWRRSVARREEIKRLLVLASEETARVELEAASGYIYSYDYGFEAEPEILSSVPTSIPAPSPPAAALQPEAIAPKPLPYECAVCSTPASARCAKCRAVRYCSGKCQIIHWRQGHKDQCHPYTNNDLKATVEEAFKNKADENCPDSVVFESDQSVESVEVSSPEFAESDDKISTLPNAEEIEQLNDGKRDKLSSDITIRTAHDNFSSSINPSHLHIDAPVNDSSYSHGSDRGQFVGAAFVKGDSLNVDQQKSVSTEREKSTCGAAGGGILSPSSTLAVPDADCQNVSSYSDRLIHASSFWEGTLDRERSKLSTLREKSNKVSCTDTLAHSGSSAHSFEPARAVLTDVGTTCSKGRGMLSDEPEPKSPEAGISGGASVHPVDLKRDSLECRRSTSLKFVVSGQEGVGKSGGENRSNSSEQKCSSSSADALLASATVPRKASTLPPLGPEKLSGEVDGTCTPKTLRCKEVKSPPAKRAEAPLVSSSGRTADRSVKRAESEHSLGAAACLLESDGLSQCVRNGLKTSVLRVVDQIKTSKLTRQSSISGTEILGKYTNKGLFPYEAFVKLYNWSKIDLHPFGLKNCGNSCYANAVLQCLAFTPPLTAYFLQGLHLKSCQRKEWCFTCEFESLLQKANEGHSPLSPSRIISHLQTIGSNLGNGREEDAHEFLRYAIDTMQSIFLKQAGVSTSSPYEEETTLIGLTFGGYLRSKIECMRCGGKSERHERMLDLTVEIDGNIGTLEEALRQFTHTETLDGENKYHCGRCKSYERAKKKLRVLEAPNVLTIALKRFQSGKFGKLNKTIKFPEILNLATYMSGTSDKSPIYQLYGVIVHVDIMNAAFSGHYVCYVKNFQNKWFKIDDSMVKAVDLEIVLTKGAYMLLYARCSPRAPRLIRSPVLPRDPRKAKHPTCRSSSHSIGPWGSLVSDAPREQNCTDRFHPNERSFRPIVEDDSSSDNSSSFFSDGCSCSTDSTHRDSVSTDDHYDHPFGDSGSWLLNSSDSDTSSSSSSPSPLYSRHSPLADLDRYACGYPETSGSCIDSGEMDLDGHGFWARIPGRCSDGKIVSEGCHTFLCSDSANKCRKLVSDCSSSCRSSGSCNSSNSYREINPCRVGRVNPSDYSKFGTSRRGNV